MTADGAGNATSIIPEDYFGLLERVGDRFQHCMSVSAIHLPDQPLVYVNRQFEIDTGYARAECLGKNCRFLQGDWDQPEARRNIAAAISDGRAVFQDVINFRKSGEPFLNRLVLLPFKYISTLDASFYIGIQRVMRGVAPAQIAKVAPRTGELENTINNPLSIALGFAEIDDVDTSLIDDAIQRIEDYIDGL